MNHLVEYIYRSYTSTIHQLYSSKNEFFKVLIEITLIQFISKKLQNFSKPA